MKKQTTTARIETQRWHAEHIRQGLREGDARKFASARAVKQVVDRLRRKSRTQSCAPPDGLLIETHQARAQSVKVNGEALTLDLADGRTIIVPLLWFPRLWNGTPRERSYFEVFGEGRYIHWPDLDEDLTVAGLLVGQKSGESLESLGKWLDSRKAASKRRGSR